MRSENYYNNDLPKDLMYYKLLKWPVQNKDYLVGIYNYIGVDQNSYILVDLYFTDFDTLSAQKCLCNFIVDICLQTYAK